MSLCGGHSEITEGIARPIVCGFAAGEVSKNGLVDKKHIAPGDDIILCRGIAIEGTALIAREHVDKLTGIDKNVVKRAEKFMEEPGICVVREALAAAGIADVHGMHDPTEGGILAGLHELTTIASVGAEIDDDAITVFPETDIICRELSLDPKGLLASGALLIVADETDTDTILRRYKEMDVPARVIGSVKEKSFGIKLKKGNEHNDIPPLSRDEITRIFQAR
jgi:hydrogenase maturation factor